MATETPSLIKGDQNFSGNVSFSGSVSLPDGTVDNDAMAAGAAGDFLAYTKAEHVKQVVYNIESPAAVTQLPLALILGATAEVIAVEALVRTPATGDYDLSLDVLAGNAATSYATILTAELELDSSTTARAINAAVLDSAEVDLADGDSLVLTITPSGSSGGQADGLIVVITYVEDPI